MKKSKNISKSKGFDLPTKEVRSAKENQHTIESVFQRNPAWQLNSVDIEHNKWGWKHLGNNDPIALLKKLSDYELRTWGEIHQDKKRDHYVAMNDLSQEAQKRLKELNLGDIEKLFRLRFEGKLRIWGILHQHIFKIIWLDPEHTVCPSSKR